MKKFRFDKPLVESPIPPNNTNVYWVDIDESIGNIKTIKLFKNNVWKNILNSNFLPNNWNLVEIPYKDFENYFETAPLYENIDDETSSYTVEVPTKNLLNTISDGKELTIFYTTTPIEGYNEYSRFIYIVSKQGRKDEESKFITVVYLRCDYHKNNGNAETGFDTIKEAGVYVYHRSSPASEFKWVSKKLAWDSFPY